MSRIVLAMSGGVDSSVAAWLLRQQGHDVVGVFMRHGVGAEESCATDIVGRNATASYKPGVKSHKQGCCSAADAADARRVAGMLQIPFYVLNFEEEFGRIVDYFVDEYTAGRTPNPCVVCNTWLKFGRLFQYADSLGADYVATGHYARLAPGDDPATPALLRGLDTWKDQSYVLFGIDRQRLPRMIFPLGGYRKEEIRRIAAQIGLGVADKPDSQEICFVPDQDHARLVKQRRGSDTSGEIVTTEGRVVGRHEGLEHFTIGQRKGLGIAFGQPRYVVRLEPEARRVVVGTQEDLARSELTASAANWLVQPPQTAIDCQVKIRYRSQGCDARVEPLDGGRFRVRFREPCYGVAPGQAAVCYRGDRVLGGGWIENALECGDSSPLSAGTDATRRLESGDESPHSKGLAPPFPI